MLTRTRRRIDQVVGCVTPVTSPESTCGQVSTEVATGTPEDEQKSDNERDPEGDPQPSLTWLAAGHMDNPGSYNPNASHTQEDRRNSLGEGRIRPPSETIHV